MGKVVFIGLTEVARCRNRIKPDEATFSGWALFQVPPTWCSKQAIPQTLVQERPPPAAHVAVRIRTATNWFTFLAGLHVVLSLAPYGRCARPIRSSGCPMRCPSSCFSLPTASWWRQVIPSPQDVIDEIEGGILDLARLPLEGAQYLTLDDAEPRMYSFGKIDLPASDGATSWQSLRFVALAGFEAGPAFPVDGAAKNQGAYGNTSASFSPTPLLSFSDNTGSLVRGHLIPTSGSFQSTERSCSGAQ